MFVLEFKHEQFKWQSFFKKIKSFIKGYAKYLKWYSKNDVLLHCYWDISCEKLLDKINLWRIIKVRNSLLVQWRGLGVLTAKRSGPLPVRELRSYMPPGMAKNKS